ncbi:hypothetical protein CSA56_13455 [candidate division KSB3 bacterium]|uniref:protein-glutamate O-methyltransferase n=1 Tax=candidate division KSB3 bacterium TaxID=2044937 RepID=A0A2G6KDJ8_9BACT|nr:MAG: hypothetical protein CSA56_13455 [candidate division KSB3 bacterium]
MTLHNTRDFESLRDFVWDKSGIYFEATKRRYFFRRLHTRMKVLGCSHLKEYSRLLQSETSGQELSELLNLLTTTETYFFRNAPQLRAFEEEILPELIQRKEQSDPLHLHFWSAGCSSGEEAYTIAMLLLEAIPRIEQWKITIVGTDINTQMLAKARSGLYMERSLRDTPQKYIDRYFQVEDGQFQICDRVRKMVTFREGNLIKQDDSSLIQNVDCVFCRNVLIYFNLDSCRQVIQIFYDNLAKRGYLLLGHSESLYRISSIFDLVKLQHSLVYRKE